MYKTQEVSVLDKSRDMGATWMFTCWALQKWLFEPGFNCLIGSQKEKKVDDRTLESIFGKIRYNIYKLPWFLKPNMDKRLKGGGYCDSHMKIINPNLGNELFGESTNTDFGRSGRASCVFLDEFASVEKSDEIWKAVRDVSDTIFCASTPKGRGNQFAKLRHTKGVPVRSLHWSLHPKKTREWYENRKKTMEPHQIAQELDIDYDASATGRVYKGFEKHLHVAKHEIEINPWAEQFITWDFGIADSMTMIFGQITPEGVIECYACYEKTDQDIEFFLPLTRGARPPDEFWHFLSDKDRNEIDSLLRRVYISRNDGEWRLLNFSHYGDHAGTHRGANSRRSIKDRMEANGIDFKSTGRQDFANRIQCFKNLLKCRRTADNQMVPKFRLCPVGCQPVLDAVLTYIWDGEDLNKQNLKPKHNWASHFMSSLEFFAINRFPIEQPSQSTSQRFR
jgi:hypothetical protein